MASESQQRVARPDVGRQTVPYSGPATEKARVASAVCVRGTVNSGASEDRSNLVGGRSFSMMVLIFR